MAYKDDLVRAGVFINEANVISAHDIYSVLTTTQIAAITTVAMPALTTTDLPTLTTTTLGTLNTGLASLGDISRAIKAMS